MVSVAVGNKIIPDIRNRQAYFMQGLKASGAAVDEQVVITLDDEQIILVERSGEGRAGAHKVERELTTIEEFY